jgi:hypothetical protein
MPSAALLKAYISLNGRSGVEDRIQKLMERMKKAVGAGKVTRDDKYSRTSPGGVQNNGRAPEKQVQSAAHPPRRTKRHQNPSQEESWQQRGSKKVRTKAAARQARMKIPPSSA